METYGQIGLLDKILISIKKSFRAGYIPLNVSMGLKKELDKRGMLR